ncbi:MAG: enoyl-ACP reductase [Candidatus Wallbacteria bacterium]|nr:enoyl-ACP reductase [Candidatus Wallbacteria bacterium]MBI4866766.1 enoyl-ACP reductase [Candidatus Wallbacteria bacterium]
MLENKLGLVLGVANKRSIAWAISRAAATRGARLALTYQGERLLEDVKELAATLPQPALLLPCDVTRDEDIDSVMARIREEFGGLDFLVHSVAFAQREDLEGNYLSTGREGFRLAHDIGAYSLTGLARAAAPLMQPRGGGSIVTMTYIGGERVVPHYNVMGIAKASLEQSVRYLAADLGAANVRVNAISAGPIKTLAARGIPHFTDMWKWAAEKSPLKRNIDVDEVADTAVFLLSSMSRGITGETIHVDAGYHIMGL